MSKQPESTANVLGRVRGPRGFGGPAAKPKDSLGTIKRVWSYMKEQRTGIVSAVAFVIVSTLLGLLAPYWIGVIVDDYILPKDAQGALKGLVGLAVLYVFASIFAWLQSYIMVRVSLAAIRRLRQDLFNKFQTLPLRFFDQRAHGDLMSRVTNDIESLNNALSQSVIQIVSTILMVLGVATAMFLLNATLAIITLLIVPFMIFATKQIIQRSGGYFIKRQRDLGELNGFIEEAISGNEVIALFGQEEKTFHQFDQVNERLRQSASAADTVSGFLGPTNNFINNLGVTLIIGAGALMTIKGTATVGVIAAFVTYSRQFFRPINQLSSLFNTLQSAIAGAERVFEIMDEPSERRENEKTIPMKSIKGDVVFSDVNFAYEDDQPVLKNISFRVNAGEKVAVVGPTGSGKTTIIHLLMRFYDASSGTITIDGQKIEEYDRDQLREKIGIVLQDTFLFSGTIMDNIRYGRLEASDEEVIAAAKLASAHEFIQRLPDGYHTRVALGGARLSQGQRQLIAIARAILADSDLLILDEATSSVDTKTEAEIQRGLDQLMKGKTSIVIAHRLKTIESADRILVIRHGELIESGTHRELLAKKGFYCELYHSQFAI